MDKQAPKKKKTLGSALADSISAEEKSVTNRFERAEEVWRSGRKAENTPRVPIPKPAEEVPEVEEPVAEKPKPPAPKKPQKVVKVIRDTFSMPPNDYDRISQIIRQCLENGISINKSEVVRAGLIALQKMPPKELADLLQELEKMKPGRKT